MKTIILLIAVAASALLAACAGMTAPQGPRLDNGDKLFLKYVDISKRTTLVNADDMTEINHLTALISTRKNTCEQGKNQALQKVREAINRNYLYGSTAEDLAASNAANRQELRRIDGSSVQGCDGRGFPKIEIN
jgi:hypothetical protein